MSPHQMKISSATSYGRAMVHAFFCGSLFSKKKILVNHALAERQLLPLGWNSFIYFALRCKALGKPYILQNHPVQKCPMYL